MRYVLRRCRFVGSWQERVVGCLCESQSGIKLAACQESSVRGDGSTTKIQADSAIKLELQSGVGAFTHLGASSEIAVSRTRPRYLGQSSTHKAHAAHIYGAYGQRSCRITRTDAADLGNGGLGTMVRGREIYPPTTRHHHRTHATRPWCCISGTLGDTSRSVGTWRSQPRI